MSVALSMAADAGLLLQGLDMVEHCVVATLTLDLLAIHVWIHRFRGGVEAEREERRLIREEDEAKKRANFEAMQQIRREGWRR
eukprot:scaffold230512_cov15-Tisochrysis_lutea.AAC.3